MYHTGYLLNINLESFLLNQEKAQMQTSSLTIMSLPLKYKDLNLRFFLSFIMFRQFTAVLLEENTPCCKIWI